MKPFLLAAVACLGITHAVNAADVTVKTAGTYALGGTWKNISFADVNGKLEARFTVKSSNANLNTDIALSDRAQTNWTFPVSVRIKNGKVLANGVGDIPFTVNALHAFRLLIDTKSNLYDAYVKVGSNSEKLIGQKIAFKRAAKKFNTAVLYGSAIRYELSDIALKDLNTSSVIVNTVGSYSLNGTWKNIAFTEQTRNFEAKFTFSSASLSVNTDIALSDRSQSDWTFPASVRIKNGKILANGVGGIPFTVNTVHAFRMVLDLESDKYAAYVKVGAGSEQLIGANIPFKRAVSGLNTLVLFGSSVSFNLSNIEIAGSSKTVEIDPPTSLPEPEPTPAPPSSPSPIPKKVYNLPAPTNVIATYYVSTSGNDKNAGTVSSPWRTIAKANSALKAGHMVIVRGGTYDEVINPANSGTASSRIYYKAYSGESVLVRAAAAGQSAVFLKQSYITVDGFKVFNHRPLKDKTKVNHIRVTGHHNHLLNLKVINLRDSVADHKAGIREHAISLVGDSNLVQKCELINNWFGINITEGSFYNIIRDNNIQSNAMDAVRLSTSLGALQGNLIEGNRMGGSKISDGVQSNGNFDLTGDALKADTSACGVIIRDNVIHDNAENGIDLKGSCHMVVEGNVIYGSVGDNDGSAIDPVDRGTGCSIHKGSNQGSRQIIIRKNIVYDNKCGVSMFDDWMIYNNTIVNNNRDYTGPNSGFVANGKPVFYGINGNAGMAINNIIGEHQSSEVLSMPSSNLFDSNLYYNTFKAVQFVADSAYTRINFSQWQGKGKDRNGAVLNPLFVNVPSKPTKNHSGLDFRLRSGSPAVDSGMSLTTTRISGSGTTIPVNDARYFYDGYGVVEGDIIRVGNNAPVRITKVDYGKKTLTVNRSISWTGGSPVDLDFRGSAPDIGALEY